MSHPPSPEVRRFANPAMLAEGAADHIARLMVETMRSRGECRIALAGGSTPRPVYEQLAAAEPAYRVRWSAVQVFFGDERCVPLDDEQSNYRMARQSLLCHVPIPEQNGASVIKCCYAATGMYMTAAATVLRESANVSTSLSHRATRRGDTKMSRRVSRRVARPACIAGVRVSRPNFSAP